MQYEAPSASYQDLVTYPLAYRSVGREERAETVAQFLEGKTECTDWEVIAQLVDLTGCQPENEELCSKLRLSTY